MPFPTGSFTEKLLMHNMQEPQPLAELRPDLPAEVLSIVARLMAKAPEDRFQTPAELVTVLAPLAAAPRSAESYRPQVNPPSEHHPTIVPSFLHLVAAPESGKGSLANSATGQDPSLTGALLRIARLASRQRRAPRSSEKAAPPRSRTRAPCAGAAARAARAGRRRLLGQAYGIVPADDPGRAQGQPQPPAGTGPTERNTGPRPTEPAKPPEPVAELLPMPKLIVPLGMIVRLRGEPAKDPLREPVAQWPVGRGELGQRLFLWDLDNPAPDAKATVIGPVDGENVDVKTVAVTDDGGHIVYGMIADDFMPPKGVAARPLPYLVDWVPGTEEPTRLPGPPKEKDNNCLVVSPAVPWFCREARRGPSAVGTSRRGPATSCVMGIVSAASLFPRTERVPSPAAAMVGSSCGTWTHARK